MDTLQKLEVELFPYCYSDGKTLVKKIKKIVTPGQYKFFDSCRKKLSSIWYIYDKRIKVLNSKYTELGEQLLKLSKGQIETKPFIYQIDEENKSKHYYEFFDESEYYYEAFLEAIEVENLFFHAKACADVFAKAVGSIFVKEGAPNNVKKLIKLLEEVKGEKKYKAQRILKEINKNKRYLRGVIFPPEQENKEQKSLRDLAIHRESMYVYFKIRLPGTKYDTGVFGGFIDTRGVLVQNFGVLDISGKLWVGLKNMIVKSFDILAGYKLEDLEG
jgi:hypothetical protein